MRKLSIFRVGWQHNKWLVAISGAETIEQALPKIQEYVGKHNQYRWQDHIEYLGDVHIDEPSVGVGTSFNPAPEPSNPTPVGGNWQFTNANSSGQWSDWQDYKPKSGLVIGDTNGGYREWRQTPAPTPNAAEGFEEWWKEKNLIMNQHLTPRAAARIGWLAALIWKEKQPNMQLRNRSGNPTTEEIE